jgi:FkbM family methyltransferase
MKIIYDLGANNGDDISYYLTKADKVVAVEANPKLANYIKDRFKNEPRVIVESCAVVTTYEKTIDFYICSDHVRSCLNTPTEEPDRYVLTTVPARNALELIKKHGKPYYIKIDIEFYDHIILEYLLKNDIKPPYISVEAHTIEVFCHLVTLGKYNKFKLIEGCMVSSEYPSFPHHAAGPFGGDIRGKWVDKEEFFKLLGERNLGWKDIHATYL